MNMYLHIEIYLKSYVHNALLLYLYLKYMYAIKELDNKQPGFTDGKGLQFSLTSEQNWRPNVLYSLDTWLSNALW
jgi:hypothetical protein